MKKRGPINFAQRFYDTFGFAHEAIYPQWNIDKDYSHSWVVLEDLPGYAEKYASIFDHYNIYTTLNYYPEEYAAARDKYQREKRHHERFLRIKPSPKESVVKERERALADLEASIPKACFIDLGFDFDVGKDIKSLDEAAVITLKLLCFFEKKKIPYQLFYTGGRGFHVIVSYRCFEQPLDENNHLVNKCMAHMMEKETGGLFIDDSIYSWRRQFRLPDSIHRSTGLYKVFITREELEKGINHVQSLAVSPRPILPVDHTPNEYLCRLYGLAKIEVNKKPKYEVKASDIRDLQAARQSAPDAGSPAQSINLLHHPPCVRDALSIGIKEGAPTNRNLITVFLATYFKAIGRSRDETTALLTDHAVRVLARFSGSSAKDIVSSTKGAVATVFRYGKYKFNCLTAKKFRFTCNDTCELFRKYRESVYNRRLQHSEMKDISGPNLFDRPDDIRKAMIERIDTYLTHYNPKKRKGKKALLVKAPAGVGKTIITFDYLSKKHWQRVCWVATQHALYNNIPERIRGRWLRIEGRHPDILDEDGNVTSEANCSRCDDAERLRRKRLNVNRHLCSICDDEDVCWYKRQFRDTTCHWFIQQRTFLYKAEEFISSFNVVVFDEDIMANFMEEIIVRARDVKVLMGYVDTLIEEMRDFGADGIDGYVALRRLLAALDALLCRDPPRKPVTGDILHRRLDEICVEMHALSLRELLDGIGPDQYEIINKIHFDIHDRELPLDFAAAFLRVLHFELFDKSESSNLSRLELRRRKKKNAPEGGEASSETVLRVCFRISMPSFNKPIIVLDATGKPEIYSVLFGREIDLFDAAYKFENKVIQLFSSASTITALNNKRHLERMLELLKHFLDEEPRTLVIGKKSLGATIRRVLPPEAEFTHFFGNRGSNEFKDFKQVIIFGAPGFREETILMYASCLYYDRNLRTATGLVARTYTGTDRAVNIYCFLDPLVQNILEVSREDEIYQALNRIRLILDSAKRVILLTNVVVEQLPVTELLSIEDVLGRREDSAKAAHRDIVRALIERQLDSIGFISAARTIRPFLESCQRTPRDIARYFSDRGATIPVPQAQKMTRRAVEDHVKELVNELSLSRYRVFYQNARCNSYFDIHGRDGACAARAVRFFKGCPGYENMTFSFKKSEIESHKNPHG